MLKFFNPCLISQNIIRLFLYSKNSIDIIFQAILSQYITWWRLREFVYSFQFNMLSMSS